MAYWFRIKQDLVNGIVGKQRGQRMKRKHGIGNDRKWKKYHLPAKLGYYLQLPQ